MPKVPTDGHVCEVGACYSEKESGKSACKVAAKPTDELKVATKTGLKDSEVLSGYLAPCNE